MKRYQAVAFLLSTAMTVSSVAPVFGASNDVFGHWAELTITKWQNEGRIGGYEDGTFKPDKAITRAEFVRLLNSAAPTAFTASTSINFSDVKESDWFYADVAKAVGGRVASGFEDGTFRPGETVTRMQAAVFICNAKGLTPNEAAANNFTDAAQIPAWAKGAVGAAVAAGYLSGYPDGSFGGSKGMTRAEAVSTLDRVLGGGSTTTTTPSGEIDTSDRDNSSTEDNRTAEAGNMVWTSGGGGGSSKKSSSSSSSSSDKKTNNVTIRSQKDADEYEGKTLTGTTTIYPDNGLELNDIKFKGDVDIKVQSDAVVASAYADSDVAVAAAYTAKINIYFEGKTSVSGTITVIENNIPSSQVVIRTRTPRKLSASVVAKVATRILGFELGKVEAQAPVEIAEGAKINTVEAGDGATVEVEESAEGVDKVDVTGDAKDIVLNGEGSTDVTVKDGATVENVKVNDNVAANIELKGDAAVTNAVEVSGNANADVKVNGDAKVENVVVSDSASADVAVADSANVGKIELKDEATAKIDVAPEAKVDEISSTSTGKTEVSGDGTVDKIEATDPSTVDTSNAGENVPEVDKKEDTTTPPTGGDSSTTATTIKGADLATLAIAKPEGAGAATITGVPEGVKASGTWAEKTAEPEVTAAAEGKTTKAYSATITLEAAEAGKVVFDTAIAAADFKGVTDVTIVEGSVNATAEKVTFDVSAEVTEGGDEPVVPEEPAIGDITATTGATNGKIVLDATKEQTVTVSAPITNIAADKVITWEINAGTTNVALAGDAEYTVKDTDVTAGVVTTTLTVPQDAVAGKVTVTAKLKETPDVTGTGTIEVISADDLTKLDKVELTPADTNAVDLEGTKEITVKVTDKSGKGMAGKTVALTLSSENSTIAAKAPAAGQAGEVTVTTGDDGTVVAVLTVGADETASEITVSATCTDGADTATATPIKVTVNQPVEVSVKTPEITVSEGFTAGTEVTKPVPVEFELVGATFKTTANSQQGEALSADLTNASGFSARLAKDPVGTNKLQYNLTADDTITEGEKTITLTIPNARFEVDENSADGKKYKLPADGKLTATIKITVAPKSGTGEGDVTTVAATAAGTVKGTPTADQTTGSIDSENNKITITLTGDYKFSTTEVGAVTASSLIKTPTDTGLTFAAALKANDTTAQTLEITVSGTPANEITDNIVIDDTALKGLIVTSTDAALTTETVKTTSTAKFAITSTGGGNEDADKVSAVEITEPTGDQTVNLNDITGDKNKITFKAKLQNSASTPADITEAGKTIKWSVAKADGDNGDIKTTAFTDIETTTVDDGIATATLTIDEATTAKALVVTAAYEGADAVTDGATPATRNITIVTKAIEAELGTVASLLTDLSVSDVDSSAQDIKTEIANKVKTAIEEKIADNTALKDIWTVKSVEVTTSEPITLEQGKENDVSITVVFQKGGADISATDTNSENKTIKVTPKTTTP